MPGLAARTCDVGNLILPVAGPLQALQAPQVHLRRIIVWRERPARTGHLFLQRRIRIELEQVQRRVLGSHANQRLDTLLPVVARLLRQPHHQVEADVVDARSPRLANGGNCPVGRMNAAQPFQLGLPERLDPEAYAIDTGGAKPFHPFGRRRLGVGFEGDLRAVGEREGVATRGDQEADLVGIQERRGAATEEDGVGGAPARAGAANLRFECLDIAPLQRRLEETAVEVAVVADGAAERDVEVEPERRHQPFEVAIRTRRAARRLPSVCDRPAERQSPQVDQRDAGARQRPRLVSSLSALHHRRPVERRAVWRQLRAVMPERARRADSRRDQLSQTGPTLGGRRAAVLRRAGQGGQLPGGRDRGALDGRARVDARRRVVSAGGVADTRGPAARPHSGDDRFQEKWRLALTLLRQVRAAGFHSPRWSAMPSSATTPPCVARCIGCSCLMRSASRRR